MARTNDLVEEALKSNPDRTVAQVRALKKKLQSPLINRPKTHAAIFSADDAEKAGLPVIKVDPASDQWQRLWRLWTKYVALGPLRIYEGYKASAVIPNTS